MYTQEVRFEIRMKIEISSPILSDGSWAQLYTLKFWRLSKNSVIRLWKNWMERGIPVFFRYQAFDFSACNSPIGGFRVGGGYFLRCLAYKEQLFSVNLMIWLWQARELPGVVYKEILPRMIVDVWWCCCWFLHGTAFGIHDTWKLNDRNPPRRSRTNSSFGLWRS